MRKKQSVTETSEKIVEKFSPNKNFGLTSVQVQKRIEEGKTNKTPNKYSKSYLSIFTQNILTFFNFLGLVVFISLIYAEAEIYNFVFVIVFLANLFIGIIQEIRAKQCIDRLSIVANKTVTVIRDGKETEIPSEDIVLEDVIKLSTGSQIPSDCTILDGEIEVNESLLTGESLPIKKVKGDSLLSGSFIISGSCVAVTYSVGSDNYAQQLSAKAKKYKKPRSEIMNSLYLLIKIIGFVIIPIAVLNIIKTLVTSNVNETIIKTSALVIGMIPSGMILLTSLALAIGIIKLARRHTLVQDLYSLEMLARVDTICFDKTGTITDGKMAVKETVVLDDNYDENTIKNITSTLLGATKDKNNTASALAGHFGAEIKFKVESATPFNSARKFSSVTLTDKGVFYIGAPEFLIKGKNYTKIKPQVDNYCEQGYRVVLLAKSKKTENPEETPNALPIALILLVDNIRKEAITTVKWFNKNGVTIKVISGDNPVTVAEVSRRAGIIGCEKYISLENLSDEEVKLAAEQYNIFGRVSPEQKAILVKALKKNGHVTAMTGDGVNDILALKESDCAISVASGSDATRSVANLVLLDNNFSSMPNIVLEGRRVINNVQGSSSLYLMKTFFVMLLSLLTLVIPNLNYPFTLKQMILLETVVIGAPSFFLSLQPNNARVEGKFLKNIIKKSLPGAIIMIITVFALQVFKDYYGKFPDEMYQSYGVFAFTIAGFINLFMICRPLNRYRSVLLLMCSLLLILSFTMSYFYGVSFLGLSKIVPPNDYDYSLIFFFVLVLLFDLILSLALNTILTNRLQPENNK